MKKNGKRLGALLLALVMVVSLVPVTALAARMEDDAVPIAAPDTAVNEARPAGAVDAVEIADVPAVLAEGEDEPPYNRANIAAGLFDVGANPTKGDDGTWSANYSRTDNGVTITAEAASYRNESAPVNAVDGLPGTNWHSNWGSSAGQGSTDMSSTPNDRYIQINLSEATEISALRYMPVTYSGNGIVTRYAVKYCNDETVSDSSVWTTIAEADDNTNWDVALTEAGNSGNTWFIAQFTSPVTTKHIRLYGVTTRQNDAGHVTNKYMTAREIRLVKAGELPELGETISGKVLDDAGAPVSGATVTLATGASYTVQAATATTDNDGAYSISVADLNDGTYYVRASKAGHGTMINTGASFAVTGHKAENIGYNVTLPAIVTKDGDYSWDFSASDRPGASDLDYISTNDTVQVTYSADDQLKLSWKTNKRDDNLVRIVDTNTKDFVIEFDATRLAPESGTASATKNARFGLAIRAQGDKTGAGQYWIYVGQTNEGKWGAELFRTTESGGVVTTKSGGWHDGDVSGSGKPTFTEGETRHFKVVASGLSIALYVDGIAIFETDNVKTFCGKTNENSVAITADDVNAAGDIGFLWGQDYDYETDRARHAIEIDNLYVLRNDPKNVLTLDTFANGTVTAKYTENSKDYPITSGTTRVPNGALVTVTGTPTNATTHVFDSMTVARTGEGEEVSVTPSSAGDNVFTFAMPNAPVTVTGKFLPVVPEDAVSIEGEAKVGKTLTAKVTISGATVSSGVVYAWYHQASAGQSEAIDATPAGWTTCKANGAPDGASITDASRGVFINDQGKKIRVVVKGDGVTYASSVSRTVETGVVVEADTPLQSVGLTRSTITMVMNDETAGTTGDTVGTTTTLTANLTPSDATLTSEGIVWSITEGSDVVALVPVADHPEQQTVNALTTGTAKVKVKVNAAENAADAVTEATVTIYVTKELKSIKVQKDGADVTGTIVIYANDSTELNAGAGQANYVDLTAVLTPEDATDVTLSWTHPHDGDDGVALIPDANDSKQVTVRPVGVDNDSVNIDATKVGDHTVTVTQSGEGENLPSATVTIRVKRLMATAISIDGDVKNGATLTADIDDLMMSNEVKETLTYQWKRGNTDISGANSETYTLTDEDVGATISVVVSAAEDDEFYEGSVTATTDDTVAKGDGPAAPSGLTGTAPTGESTNDGKITGLQANTAYEYVAKTGNTTPESGWADLTAETGLASGEYWVRIKATDYNEAGAAAQVTVPAYNDTRPTITKAAMTNGSVTAPDRAAENETVTITVAPATGYQLSAGTLTVTKASGDTVDVAAVEGQANQYTFTMPDENVTISAQFEPIKVTITHNLTHLVCSKGTADSHTVNWGETAAITINPETGYSRPAKSDITVVGADGVALGDSAWSYNATTGAITITGGVKQNITVTAAGVPAKYTVTYTLTNGLASSNSGQATYNTAYTTTLSVQTASASTYERPDTITVKRGETTLVLDTDYTYDKTTGAVTIKAEAVTGALSITAAGKRKTTPLTEVTIGIQHTDSNTTETTIPHVGDTLLATPKAGATTEGVTASYEWYVDGTKVTDVADATGQSYVVREGDVDKAIQVKAKGTGSYSGTVESTTTAAVKVKTVKATSITLPHTATVEVNKTVTLTATVTPEGANANNTVSWTSSDTAVATVANGVVTGKKAGTATITATLSEGQDSTCEVTVTAPLTNVVFDGTAKVGETLTANVTPADATVTYAWARVAADNTETTISNATAKTYTLVEADKDCKIKVTVTGTGNYTGTVSRTTTNAVVAADEEAPLDTAALDDTIAAAKEAMEGIQTIDKNEDEVAEGTKFVTTAEMEALTDAIAAAETAKGEAEDQAAVDAAKAALDAAVDTFNQAIKEGTKPVVDTTALNDAIKAAEAAKKNIQIKPEDTDPGTVNKGTKYATQEVMDALDAAIEAAEKADTTDAEAVQAATDALNAAVEAFKAELKTGTKQTSSNRPSSSTSTVTNPDGSVTTTVTKPDGTKTQTTEKPDGTVETVKTQPDGTVMEIVVAPDGTKESVATKPDGTVTETVTDAEGATTEKVTDPEENVVITVTDPEGEELAKVEIPAEIPEPETKFDDAVDHWAEESINKVAALGLMNGMGDNKYGTESSLTRGQLATVLYRLSNGKSGYRVSFSDVELGQYYTDGVAWAAKAKVVTGYTTDIFAPEDTITREQLAVMLCRYAKLIGMDTTANASSLNAFADGGSTGAWAVDGMAWCVANGILQGRGQSNLDPTSKVTRAEVAVMLDRFIELIK